MVKKLTPMVHQRYILKWIEIIGCAWLNVTGYNNNSQSKVELIASGNDPQKIKEMEICK